MTKHPHFIITWLYIVLLGFVLTASTINSYFFCGTTLIGLIYFRGGFHNAIRCGALFNVFFIFFVFIGVLGSNLLREDYNYKLSTAVLLSLWSFNLPYIIKGYNYKTHVVYTYTKWRKTSTICHFFIGMGFLMGVLYYLKIRTIPLLSAGSVGERIEAISGAGIYLYFVRAGIYSSIILYLISRTKTYIYLFILLNLMLLGTSFRGEFMQNFLLFSFVFINYNKTQVSKTKLFLGGLGIIIASFALGALRGDSPNLNSITLKFINMGAVGIYVLNLVFEHFTDFQHGATLFFGIGSIFHVSTEFTQWLTQQLPIVFDGGVTPTIVGDFYINFADFYWMPFIALGFFSQRIDYKLAYQRNNIFNVIIFTNLTIYIARSVSGGVSNVFLLAFFSTLFFVAITLFVKIKLK